MSDTDSDAVASPVLSTPSRSVVSHRCDGFGSIGVCRGDAPPTDYPIDWNRADHASPRQSCWDKKGAADRSANPCGIKNGLVGLRMALWDQDWPCGVKIGMRGD